MTTKPRWKPGSLYTSTPTGTLISDAQILNELRVSPIDVPRATRIDQLACEVSVAAASATIRLCVYADTGNSEPGALVLATGTIDASTTGLKTVTVSLGLAARRYWIGYVNQGAAVSMRSASAVTREAVGVTNANYATFTPFSNGNGASAFYQGSVTGAPFSTFTIEGVRVKAGLVFARAV